MEGVGEKVESMEDAVFVSDSGMGEVVVAEFNSVGEEKLVASEGPGRACAGFVVDDDRASNGAKGSDIKVEGDVVVFPVGYSSGEGGSAKEI